MIIKSYNLFTESSKYSYGCLMLEIKFPNWKEIISKINKKDLCGNGKETYPHCTLLYGLESTVTKEDVSESLKDIDLSSIKSITTNKMSIFENEKFDVVKFEVFQSRQLIDMFNAICHLPNSNKFSIFIPHVTVAYVNPGCGQQYLKDVEDREIQVTDIVYSKSNGQVFSLMP